MKHKNLLLLTFLLISLYTKAQWDHSAFRATSTDGMNWTRDTNLLLYPASVPKAVIDTNGTIFLYYIYMANSTAIETIKVSTSTDGKNFTTPQFITITNNVTKNRFDPKPILLKDGRIRIYYVDASLIPPHDVYSAVSNDGINFTEETGIRFVHNEITDPDVFIVDSNWVLFVPSINGMVRAVSADEGLTFIEDNTFSWAQATVFGTFKYDVGTYRTYYCSNGDILSATSTNCYDLVPDTGTRIKSFTNETLCDPSVIKFNGEYIMYYKSQGYYVAGNIEPMIQEKVEIYPNPLQENNALTINLPSHGNCQIKMYNSIGALVCSQPLESQTNELNSGYFKEGIYFYSITKESKIIHSGNLMVVR